MIKQLMLLTALISACSDNPVNNTSNISTDKTHFQNGDYCNCDYIDRELEYKNNGTILILYEKPMLISGVPLGTGRGYSNGVLTYVEIYGIDPNYRSSYEFDANGYMLEYVEDELTETNSCQFLNGQLITIQSDIYSDTPQVSDCSVDSTCRYHKCYDMKNLSPQQLI